MAVQTIGKFKGDWSSAAHGIAQDTLLSNVYNTFSSVPELYAYTMQNDSPMKYFISPLEFMDMNGNKWKDFVWNYDSIQFVENKDNLQGKTDFQNKYDGYTSGGVIDLINTAGNVVDGATFGQYGEMQFANQVSDNGTRAIFPADLKNSANYEFKNAVLGFNVTHAIDSFSTLRVRANSTELIIHLRSWRYDNGSYIYDIVYRITKSKIEIWYAGTGWYFFGQTVEPIGTITHNLTTLTLNTQYTQNAFNFGVQSGNKITININQTPNTPPTNNPKGTVSTPAIITTTTPTLDWSFSDPDAGNIQSAYQVRVRDTAAAEGVYVHDTGKVTSALTDYVIPSGNLIVGKTYTWEVTTWDAANAQSAWSSPEYFTISTLGTVGDKVTLNYTGGVQNYVVPGNVTKIKVELFGAKGGDYNATRVGGQGGKAWGDLPVTPGETLQIRVGGKGTANNTAAGTIIGGGYNGGGGAYATGGNYATGGGGATDIRRGAAALVDRLLIAAGGGGATIDYAGGSGGGTTGTAGAGRGAAGGGTQTAGGTNNTDAACNGSLGVGGNGKGNVDGGVSSPAGGGGGYYGGAGGYYGSTPLSGSGGGGSSFYGTLANGGTTAGIQNGDGQAVITVLETSSPSTVINRDPGVTDQTTPEGTGLTPLFTWDYSGAFVQSKYQIKIFNPDGSVKHDTGLLTSSNKQHQIGAGVLNGGVVYGWELTVVDNNNISYPNNRLYFITNNLPIGPTPSSPTNTRRTNKRPVFEALIGDDIENDNQKFVIQLAEDNAFTVNLQERSSETSQVGWMAKTASGSFASIPANGVDSTFEGGTVQYTWQTDLTDGKTYYWRMWAIDATTGARGPFGAARSIRVGNILEVKTKNPIVTSAHAERVIFTIQKTVATDGTMPASFKVEVANNALDSSPTWEDATAAFNAGEYYEFTNLVKTAENWAIGFKITINANDSLGVIEIAGIGFSFD